MEIKTSLFIVLKILFSSLVLAQPGGQNDYCSKEAGRTIDFKITETKFYATYKEGSSGLSIKLINPTNETLYLFKSYLSEEYHTSRYLHRVNEKESSYKFSFLPLLPYLSTRPTDKRILGSNRIVNKGQVLYNFVTLNPNSYYEIHIGHSAFELRQNLICDFDTSETSKFKPIKFKSIKSRKLNKLDLIFEFAVYEKVDLLCNESAYYLNEFDFDDQARSFRIISVPVELEYEHPFF